MPYQASEFHLPSQTGGLVAAAANARTIDNRFLWYRRYVPCANIQDQAQETERRNNFLQQTCASPMAESALLTALGQQRSIMLVDLERRGRPVVHFTLATALPMIHGLGNKGYFEVGFTFHPLYGTPYLPGTSLKGLASSFAQHYHLAPREFNPRKEKERLGKFPQPLQFLGAFEEQGEEMVRHNLEAIFGTTEAAGQVDFLDAFLLKGVTLEQDIMNPHYPDYYRGEAEPTKAPQDDQDPNPVTFLVVPPETRFDFTLVGRPGNDHLVQQAAAYLLGALTQLGAGGKTSAGYGLFTDPAQDEQGSRVSPSQPDRVLPPPSAINSENPTERLFAQFKEMNLPKEKGGRVPQWFEQVGKLPPDQRKVLSLRCLALLRDERHMKDRQIKETMPSRYSATLFTWADEG